MSSHHYLTRFQMKNFIVILLVFCTVTLLPAQTADEIIFKAESSIKGSTARGLIEMRVTTPEYTRTLEMESWWVGNEKALIVIKSPAKERGNKTLKLHNEMWNYLRNTETTIKIPPSMMLQSWNGSDFTNDDLVRESNLNDDYTAKVISEESVNEADCWKIELIPKPEAPVVWGKLYYWVRKIDYLPSIVQYFDEEGKEIRYMEFLEIKQFGKRKLPSIWTMHSNIKENSSTYFKIIEMEFDIKISDRIFSFQELEKGI